MQPPNFRMLGEGWSLAQGLGPKAKTLIGGRGGRLERGKVQMEGVNPGSLSSVRSLSLGLLVNCGSIFLPVLVRDGRPAAQGSLWVWREPSGSLGVRRKRGWERGCGTVQGAQGQESGGGRTHQALSVLSPPHSLSTKEAGPGHLGERM